MPTPKDLLALLALAALTGPPSFATPSSARTADEADDRYRFLAGLVEKGMHELAVDEAEGFLRDFPKHPRADLARYRLASALFALERLPAARPHYTRLSKLDDFEYRYECLFRAGQCAMAENAYAEAEALLEPVVRGPQDYLHPAALFLLGDCAQRQGKLDEAAGHFDTLVQKAPDTTHARAARRSLVWVAWQQRQADRTVALAADYLKRHADGPEADEVRLLSGEALAELGRPQEALAAYRSVGAGSSQEAALRGIGFALAASKAHAEAAKAFDDQLARFPQGRFVAEAKLQRGVQRLLAGDAAGAREALAAADAKDPEAQFWLARALEALDRNEDALAALERAARAQPNAELSGRINVARGNLLAKLGRGGDALAAFENAESEYGLAAAAATGLNAGEFEQAARLANRLLERNAESEYRPQALFVLAEVDFKSERYPEARARYEELAGRDDAPAEPSRLLSRIGWCDFLAGDPLAAARSFGAVVERYGQSEEAQEAAYMLGRSLHDAGRRDETVQAWSSFLERYPEAPQRAEVLYALGGLVGDGGSRLLAELAREHRDSELAPRALFELAEKAAQAGKTDEAVQAYEDLLSLSPDGPLADRARYGLAWLLHDGGLSKRALPLLTALEEAREAPAELKLAASELAVWAFAAAGDPEGAERAWRGFVKRSASDADDYRAARRVAEAWKSAGELQRARTVFDELLRGLQDPSVAVDVLVEGAYAALDEGDVDRAEAQVRVADRQGVGAERVAEVAFFVAEARAEAGDEERAVPLYERAAANGGELADDALYRLGFTRLSKGALAEAATAFEALATQHAESELYGESLFLLGETYYRQERFEDCLRTLERLRREAPRHEVLPKALFRLGLAAGRLERWELCETALAQLVKSEEDFPNLAEAELWRGKALAAQRKGRAARQAFDRTIALDRGALAAEARLGVGGLLRAEGRLEEALAEFLKVAVLYEHDVHVPAALYAAGECLEAQGDADRARERYGEVLADYASSPSAEPARAALRRLESL